MGVFLIVFREFMESFLLMSVLVGFSRKQDLHKEKVILAGGALGILFSVIITFCAFYLFPKIHISLPSDWVDTVGHIAIIVSGMLLLYITYRIHPFFSELKNNKVHDLISANKIEKTPFFLSSFLLVLQEGFEIVVFSTTAVFSQSPVSNYISLSAGFITAVLVSFVLYKTYLKNHVQQLFKLTEYAFIIYGIYLIYHGSVELMEQFLH